MEKVISGIEETCEKKVISKSMVKGKIKSLKKVSKAYRALQIIKYDTRIAVYKVVKRTVDICAGLVGTMLLLPIMAVVKIAYLKQGDHAPVLFKQKRIGKDGKEIEILKVRSMVNNAEEVLEKLMKENPKIREEYTKNKKLEHDPRVTKVGAFIRKTSLDEFGQFVAVLTGKMSLIGPRPYLPREKEDMGEYYNDVIKNKPGLTGLWQARGRSDVGFENRCKLDRFYEEHKGLWFDFKILMWTVVSVLQSKGAK
ncbi:MAG: sugar transferase [Clostridia bacterium]|nr:sugar transferase [Clostridia bacterium]